MLEISVSYLFPFRFTNPHKTAYSLINIVRFLPDLDRIHLPRSTLGGLRLWCGGSVYSSGFVDIPFHWCQPSESGPKPNAEAWVTYLLFIPDGTQNCNISNASTLTLALVLGEGIRRLLYLLTFRVDVGTPCSHRCLLCLAIVSCSCNNG